MRFDGLDKDRNQLQILQFIIISSPHQYIAFMNEEQLTGDCVFLCFIFYLNFYSNRITSKDYS